MCCPAHKGHFEFPGVSRIINCHQVTFKPNNATTVLEYITLQYNYTIFCGIKQDLPFIAMPSRYHALVTHLQSLLTNSVSKPFVADSRVNGTIWKPLNQNSIFLNL